MKYNKNDKFPYYKINVNDWKEFKIADLFQVELSKGDLKENECLSGYIPLVSSGSLNNGVAKYIDKNCDDEAQMFTKNKITVDMFGQAYYQAFDFYSVSHGRVNILIPKNETVFNEYIALFICTIINREQYKFSYNRAVYKTVIENLTIKLPIKQELNKKQKTMFDDIQYLYEPDWQFMEDYIKNIYIFLKKNMKTQNQLKNSKINKCRWKNFVFNDIFTIQKGKDLVSENDEGSMLLISSTSINNGVSKFILSGNYLFNGNKITVASNGSIGSSFYQYKSFYATTDVNIITLKNHILNKYIALFLCTVISFEKYKFSYGRKWDIKKMLSSRLSLPTKNNEPDWQYMEDYIRSLPYADLV